MRLRWEADPTTPSAPEPKAYWGHAGEHVVALVVFPSAGPNLGKWVWQVNGVQLHGVSGGARATAKGAMNAADAAFSRWCEQAGLHSKD